jgi:hypothetical protein
MQKRIFESAAEALRYVRADPRALVTYSVNRVFVSAARGMGSFPLAEWRDAGGPGPSVVTNA